MVVEIINIIILILSVFLFNINPLFTIPTWVIFSIFIGEQSLITSLPFLFVAILSSTLGRFLLAKYFAPAAERFLPRKQKGTIKYLRYFMADRKGSLWPFLVSFLYSISPLPTNALFIVAGVARVHLSAIVGGFFLGELVSSLIYISLLKATLSVENYLVVGALGLILTVAVLFADWKRIIKYFVEREKRKRAEESLKEMYKDNL